MPKSREKIEEIKERRKQNIVLAGLKIFCEKGFDGATIDEIVTKAECSHGLFYHYFKNKKEIFDAVIESAQNFSDDTLENILKENISAKDKLLKCVRFFFDNLDREDMAYYFYFFISRRFIRSVEGIEKDRPPKHKRPAREIIEQIFREGVENGEFTDKYSLRECCTLFHAIIQGATLNYILLPPEYKNTYKKPNVQFTVEIFLR